MFFFLLYPFFCFSFGCSFFQNAEEQEEQQLSSSIVTKDSSYTDDKMTLHIKNATPEQIDLFTTKYKNFAAETYLFFQPHIHQIVLDGQIPNGSQVLMGTIV